VGELEREDLIVPRSTANGSVDLGGLVEAPPAGVSFRAPRLEKHTDMQDLILLDPVHEVDPQRGWPHVPEHSNG
jgi:hypothetical protein